MQPTLLYHWENDAVRRDQLLKQLLVFIELF